MHHIEGKPQSKIDTGLDSYLLNYHIAEVRSKTRDQEINKRKKNPLTYPTKGEKLRDQKRVIPTQQTLQKFGITNKKRYMGNIELENMIMDNMSKYGLLVSTNQQATENPALLREAFRPSLVTQHINFQSRKIWKRNKEKKKEEKVLGKLKTQLFNLPGIE